MLNVSLVSILKFRRNNQIYEYFKKQTLRIFNLISFIYVRMNVYSRRQLWKSPNSRIRKKRRGLSHSWLQPRRQKMSFLFRIGQNLSSLPHTCEEGWKDRGRESRISKTQSVNTGNRLTSYGRHGQTLS